LEFFEYNFKVSLRRSLSADPNIMDPIKREHPEILAWLGEGYLKTGFPHTKTPISLKRGKIGPRLLLRVKFCHSPLTLTVVLTTLSHYRVSVW